MKARFFITALFVCMWAIGFSQKRLTYLISATPIGFEILHNKSLSNDNTQKNENITPATTQITIADKSQKEEVTLDPNIDEQTILDMYYIAYLIKVELLNTKFQKEIEGKYDMQAIMQLVKNTPEKELYKMSKGNSKQAYKYRK